MARVWFPFLGFRLQSVEDTKLAKGRSSFFFWIGMASGSRSGECSVCFWFQFLVVIVESAIYFILRLS